MTNEQWVQLAMMLGMGAAGAYGAKKDAKAKNKPQEMYQEVTKTPYMAGALNPQLQMIAAMAAQQFGKHKKKLDPNFNWADYNVLPWGETISDPFSVGGGGGKVRRG